jgi:hypothetical protein
MDSIDGEIPAKVLDDLVNTEKVWIFSDGLRINVDRKYLFSLNLKVQTVTV